MKRQLKLIILLSSLAHPSCGQITPFDASIDKVSYSAIPERKDGLQILIVGSDRGKLGERYGICDKNKKILIEPQYAGIEYLGHSLFAAELRRAVPTSFVQRGGYNYGSDEFEIIDITGQRITETTYNMVNGYWKDSCELIFVNKGYTFVFPNDGNSGLYGAINTKGEVVIPIKYAKCFALSPEVVYAQEDMGSKVGYLDTKNKILQPFIYSSVDVYNGFKSGMTIIYKDGEGYGFMNKKGEIVLKPQFPEVTPFEDGHAVIFYRHDIRTSDYLCSIIDSTAKILNDSIRAPLHHAGHGFMEGFYDEHTYVYTRFGELIYKVPRNRGYLHYSEDGAHILVSTNERMEFIITHDRKKIIRYCPEGVNCEEQLKLLTP